MDKKKQPTIQPDPETTHTTDPQEHMEGPISSIMQNIREAAEENAEKDAKDEDKKDALKGTESKDQA